MLNYDNKKNEAIITTVYPVVNGNGANYIAMNLAYAAKEKDPHAKIAVVDFDFNHPYLGLALQDDRYHGIDNLIDKINGGFLDEDLFTENMVMLKEDIYLLKGTKMGRFQSVVRQEHLQDIVAHLKKLYDYVFIATNAEATDGGTPVGLFSANNILILGRYNQANKAMAQKASNNITAMAGPADIGILYNFYDGQNGISLNEEFGQWLVFGTVPYQSETVDNINLYDRGLSLSKLGGGKRTKGTNVQETYANVLEAFHI